jgi:DNA transformation protein and related proteins
MFGGQGVFLGERIFAVEAGGELYLKADRSTVKRFQAAGSRAFAYQRDGKVATMSYWRLPAEGADDPDEAARWGRLALEAADRAAKSRREKTRRCGRI